MIKLLICIVIYLVVSYCNMYCHKAKKNKRKEIIIFLSANHFDYCQFFSFHVTVLGLAF